MFDRLKGVVHLDRLPGDERRRVVGRGEGANRLERLRPGAGPRKRLPLVLRFEPQDHRHGPAVGADQHAPRQVD